ncbi:unnamed protein product [Protopolystoma xenopodis]|uniref:Uncharacterized protein n=1 Tax=Protopolystoma xenopodis TaxID=117903 RepID=A0A3S5C6I0_9PLAT|nr:unnamed protein product [Protopolystoma xenopodis]
MGDTSIGFTCLCNELLRVVVRLARLTDDAGDTTGNVPRRPSDSGNDDAFVWVPLEAHTRRKIQKTGDAHPPANKLLRELRLINSERLCEGRPTLEDMQQVYQGSMHFANIGTLIIVIFVSVILPGAAAGLQVFSSDMFYVWVRLTVQGVHLTRIQMGIN